MSPVTSYLASQFRSVLLLEFLCGAINGSVLEGGAVDFEDQGVGSHVFIRNVLAHLSV